ncbi:MAG: hypothetical protein Q7J64_02570, partial [Elusimicrobiota bacterium]|nr:hypothetical protein [Elusimicrobiota bacterium]
LAALMAAACTGPRQADFPQPLPPAPPIAVQELKDPNFEAVVVETVPNADEEGVAFTMIFVDGKEAGKTAVGPRSQEKRVRLKLPTGNLPVRLEHWFLPPVGEWTLLPEGQQPRERFVRIEDGTIARLTLRYDPAGRPSLALSREPAAPR